MHDADSVWYLLAYETCVTQGNECLVHMTIDSLLSLSLFSWINSQSADAQTLYHHCKDVISNLGLSLEGMT